MPDLERIQQLTPGTLSQQWYEDGAAVDPGTVTIGITRADGTVLIAPGAATSGTTTGPRTYNLTAATHTTLLDTLKVTWTSTLKGTLVSYVEVVGGFLFSIAEARAIAPLSNTTNYPTASIVAMRTLVEQALEDACGVAFVPRYTRETLSGDGGTLLLTKWPKVTAVRSVSVAGVALTAGELLTLAPAGSGSVYYPGSWAAGYSNVIVGYEHGYSSPPERVRRAALFEARYRILQANSPTDDRATMLSNDQGTYSLVTPGGRGNGFWLPETNQICAEYGGYNVGVA